MEAVSLRIRSALELPAGQLRDQVARQLDVVPRETPAPAKRPKYGNQVVELEGKRFDSKWELKRYQELLEQQAAGLIADLRHHVSFALHAMTPTGDRVRIASYEADLVYRRGEELVIEDAKSEVTRRKEGYRLKAAWFEAEYDLKVLDVVRVRRKRAEREVRCG
jgi:hypothetical protein